MASVDAGEFSRPGHQMETYANEYGCSCNRELRFLNAYRWEDHADHPDHQDEWRA